MGTDIQKFFGGHKPAERSKLAEALTGLASAKNALVGKALLRFTKQGVWVFGADNEAFDTKNYLIGNPSSISSGYVAWYLGKIEGERMQPITAGPVDASTLSEVNSGTVPPGKKEASGRGWESQVAIDLMTNDDPPLSLIYKTSSRGGMMALLGLAGEIAIGMEENPDRAFPLIELGSDFYVHAEWGKVFTPVISVAGWLDSEGNPVIDKAKLTNRRGLV